MLLLIMPSYILLQQVDWLVVLFVVAPKKWENPKNKVCAREKKTEKMHSAQNEKKKKRERIRFSFFFFHFFWFIMCVSAQCAQLCVNLSYHTICCCCCCCYISERYTEHNEQASRDDEARERERAKEKKRKKKISNWICFLFVCLFVCLFVS